MPLAGPAGGLRELEDRVNRHRRWSGDGTWEQILGRLRAGCDEAEGKDWTLSADSTVVRAHQHAVGARRARPADLLTGGGGE
jgi:transposase